MHRSSILKVFWFHCLFFFIFISMGYKTNRKQPRLKIHEQTVRLTPVVQPKAPLSHAPSSSAPRKQPPNTPVSTPAKKPPLPKTPLTPSKPSQSESKKISTNPSKTNPPPNKTALQTLAQQLLKDSESLLQSLEKTDKVCSAIQRLTTHVNVSHNLREQDQNFVSEIVTIIQDSLSLPQPGSVRIRLEIFPEENRTSCSIEDCDEERNKNYVLHEMSRISFKEIVKKYNFRKKIVFQIKLIGNAT